MQALGRCDGAVYGWPSVSALARRKGVKHPLKMMQQGRGEGSEAVTVLRSFLLARHCSFRVDGDDCVEPLQTVPVSRSPVLTAVASHTALCGHFALLGRCDDLACPLRHAFFNAAEQDHAAWRGHGRSQLARAEAQLSVAVPACRLDPWPFAVPTGRRRIRGGHGKAATVDGASVTTETSQASVFATWLVRIFGRERLAAGGGVLDVAGGHGGLALALAQRGVPCVVVDPLSLSAHRQHPAGRQSVEPAAGPSSPVLTEYGGDEGTTTTVFVREMFDAAFVDRRRDLLDASSVVVGLHPDEATGAIVEGACLVGKPWAVVPCCVFSKLFPERTLPPSAEGGTRRVVGSTTDLTEWILREYPTSRCGQLPFRGQNKVCYSLCEPE